jgi:hypothetical protein
MGKKGCNLAPSLGAGLRAFWRIWWLLTNPVEQGDKLFYGETPGYQDLNTFFQGYTDPKTGQTYFNRVCQLNDLCSAACACLHEYVHHLQVIWRIAPPHGYQREIPALLIGGMCNFAPVGAMVAVGWDRLF